MADALGLFEQAVLLAIVRLGEVAYGRSNNLWRGLKLPLKGYL